jgi:hypothetical protein
MKLTREQAFAFGGDAEQLVVSMLKAEGKFVLPAGALDMGAPGRGAPGARSSTEFLIAPDLLAMVRGRTEWIEVKGKASSTLRRQTGCHETGFSQRQLAHYISFQAQAGILGHVVFVHVAQREVLTAPVDRFKKARIAKDDGTVETFGEPMVFIQCEDLDLWMTFDEIDKRVPFGTKKLTASRIARAQDLADSVFGFDSDTVFVPDTRMMDTIYKLGIHLGPRDAVHGSRPLDYATRRRLYYWIRTSTSGIEWAKGERAGLALIEPDRPARVERFTQPFDLAAWEAANPPSPPPAGSPYHVRGGAAAGCACLTCRPATRGGAANDTAGDEKGAAE